MGVSQDDEVAFTHFGDTNHGSQLRSLFLPIFGCQQKIQKLNDDQKRELIKAQDKANQASADYEKLKSEQRVKNKVVIKEVQKIIDRPVYRNICIDADGVSAINSLIPKIPANLLVPCADLQELESGQGSDLMLWSVDTVIQYNQCQTKHGAIVKALE